MSTPISLLPLVLLILAPHSAPADYDAAKERLEAARLRLATELRTAPDDDARREVYQRARSVLVDGLTRELLPVWEGTAWAMNGTSATPREGTIACGTFVGTVLEHAGFRLNRIALGQLASEHIALSLTENTNLRRYRDRPAAEVEADLIAWGEGIYVVGLDYHAALAHVDAEGRAWFIHSTYVGKGEVIREPLLGENPFTDSRYRVLAKLFDDRMVRRWLLGTWFEARGKR